MDSALFDFAEAAMGKNTNMSWSLSPDVLRRQVSPVFVRCASRDLTAEEALDVAIDFVVARVSNMLEVFHGLYQTLASRIDVQMHGQEFPALVELEEFFLGLNSDVQWAIDSDITRRELHALFEKVYAGVYNPRTGVYVFCDTIMSKKQYYLDLIHRMCLQLTEEILASRETLGAPVDPDGPERKANGDV